MKQSRLITFGIITMVALIFVLALSSSIFLTIDPGQRGVLFKRFGGGLDKQHIYKQGFQVIAPWNTMYIYDVRLNESFESMTVLSKNGLKITVDLSYRYQPIGDKIGYIHDEINQSS